MSILTRAIDFGNPVSDHPLNEGLTSWWMGLPNNSGGSRLFDLCNRYHGTITNGPAWKGGPYGFPTIDFLGSAGNVIDLDQAGTFGTGAFTVEAMIFLKAEIFSPIVSRVVEAGAYPQEWILYYNPYEFRFQSSANSYTYAASTTNPISQWILLHGIYGGSTNRNRSIALNGRIESTVTNTTEITGLSTRTGIGNRYTGSAWNDSPSNLVIGHVAFFNEALSASRLSARYDQWRRGFPDLLRRIPSRVWSFATTGGGGGGTTETPAAVVVTGTVVAPATALAHSPAPVTATATPVDPTVVLTATFAPVSATAAVVTPAAALTQSPAATSATATVVTPATSVAQSATPIVATATVVTPSTSGQLTETPSAVATTASLVTPATTLAQSGTPAVATFSVITPTASAGLTETPAAVATTATVVTPGTTLVQDATPITGAFSVVTPSAGGTITETPAATSATASVVTPATSIAQSMAAIAATFTLPIPGTTLVGVDLLDGLGAYYRFDGDLTDSSGNGRDLTGLGTYQTGKLNQELATGSGSRTPLGGLTDTSVTISAWLTSTAGGSGDGIGCLVGFGGDLLAIRCADDSVQWMFDSAIEWSELVDPATRYHVVVTLDGTTAKMYLDGSQVYAGTVPVVSGWSSGLFQINTTGDVTTAADEVAIYTRAITAAEVAALYNSGSGYDPTNITAVSPGGTFRRAAWSLARAFRRAAPSLARTWRKR